MVRGLAFQNGWPALGVLLELYVLYGGERLFSGGLLAGWDDCWKIGQSFARKKVAKDFWVGVVLK